MMPSVSGQTARLDKGLILGLVQQHGLPENDDGPNP